MAGAVPEKINLHTSWCDVFRATNPCNESIIYPLSTDIATTTPFIEENPLLCQVPSTVTPISKMFVELFFYSITVSIIDVSATSFAASQT